MSQAVLVVSGLGLQSLLGHQAVCHLFLFSYMFPYQSGQHCLWLSVSLNYLNTILFLPHASFIIGAVLHQLLWSHSSARKEMTTAQQPQGSWKCPAPFWLGGARGLILAKWLEQRWCFLCGFLCQSFVVEIMGGVARLRDIHGQLNHTLSQASCPGFSSASWLTGCEYEEKLHCVKYSEILGLICYCNVRENFSPLTK